MMIEPLPLTLGNAVCGTIVPATLNVIVSGVFCPAGHRSCWELVLAAVIAS